MTETSIPLWTHFVSVQFITLIACLFLAAAVWRKRLTALAVTLAIIPAVAFVLASIAYTSTDAHLAHIDLIMNYQGALALYRDGITPYATNGAISFPFPTFYLYAVASGFGANSMSTTWFIWSLVNGALWWLASWAILRTVPTNYRREVLLVCVAIPAVTIMMTAQTTLYILAGVALLHYALISERRLWWMIGGAGLAIATLVKPQLGIIGLGMALWWLLMRRDTRKVWTIGIAAVVTVAGAIMATLLLPGGVEAEHYVQFAREVLPAIGLHSEPLPYNSSLAYAVRFATGSDAAGNLTTLAILATGALWTYLRRDAGLLSIAAGWGVWAAVAPMIAWGQYAVWCLPFFALQMVWHLRNGDRTRAALVILLLGLLGWQPPYQAWNVAVMLTLCAATRQSWRPARAAHRTAVGQTVAAR